ncbi:MAG: hypothetical protein KGL44_04405 [Sphingomonadales bacterium]|nr:hypothetical protein [Sphingomonadales bacterium]
MMILPLFAALALAAEPAPAAAPPMIVGGWSVVAEPSGDAEVGRAAAFATSRIKRHHPRLARVERAERQVVAGTNFRMTIVLTDHTRWQVTVWKQLDGTYALTASERVRQARP